MYLLQGTLLYLLNMYLLYIYIYTKPSSAYVPAPGDTTTPAVYVPVIYIYTKPSSAYVPAPGDTTTTTV